MALPPCHKSNTHYPRGSKLQCPIPTGFRTSTPNVHNAHRLGPRLCGRAIADSAHHQSVSVVCPELPSLTNFVEGSAQFDQFCGGIGSWSNRECPVEALTFQGQTEPLHKTGQTEQIRGSPDIRDQIPPQNWSNLECQGFHGAQNVRGSEIA